ncbi:DUF3500 domain-containing protein [Corallococcus carmarthensis]|uniref:DUF3500 domain-containing protein n=1 Tax=Corallococcus carmarthensis TaxID=2316728 RepID=UPI00148E10A7|nr:DUF3500 domain-containing protein [Corallococcus carmarthensis]NOK16711.1 DUF3500 domain-containing protein [Corallococcus carmarthensis]
MLALGACGDDPDPGASPDAGTGADAGTQADAGTEDGGTTPANCATAATHIEQVVCASNAFLATLTEAQRAAVLYAWTAQVEKTYWSNLPGVTRNGLKWGTLSAESKTAALNLASLVLTAEGYADMTGVFAADDYLDQQGGSTGGGPGGDGGTGGPPGGDGGMGGPPGDGGMGGPPGGDGGMGGLVLDYSSDNYVIAFIGTPSTTGNWMLQIGGHHMAFNVTYLGGTGYPTPNHLGAEPKAPFTLDGGGTYAPLVDDGDAMVAMYDALTPAQLDAAYITGTYSDVVLGPVEFGTGSYSNVVFPTQQGVLVSTLTESQQALVTAAIKQWVADFAPAIADPLVAAYTSADAYAHTYVAWAGTKSAGVDVDLNGTYMRIDGPRVWLEVACQQGVVLRDNTHYHTIYRDKQTDYGNQLTQ